jgi:endonuclease YncB( thermonuclease family)
MRGLSATGESATIGTMHALWAIIIAVALIGRLIAADPVEWKVVAVHDGDTLTAVDADNVQHKVRLHGIDAPEAKQVFGTKARDRLADLTLRKVVRVNVHEHDRYGWLLGRHRGRRPEPEPSNGGRRYGVALCPVQQGCRTGRWRA